MTTTITFLGSGVTESAPGSVTDPDEIRATRDATIAVIDELLAEVVSVGDTMHTPTEWKTRCTAFHRLQRLRASLTRLDCDNPASIDRIGEFGDALAATVRALAMLRTPRKPVWRRGE